ncbi:hypothetical protein BD779DRAFT_1543495 [Infundibulicybe gibba]|nr:hypothetical protein BD779DRAFT_1543495 [Infundibulicybe gibba]
MMCRWACWGYGCAAAFRVGVVLLHGGVSSCCALLCMNRIPNAREGRHPRVLGTLSMRGRDYQHPGGSLSGDGGEVSEQTVAGAWVTVWR